MTFCEVKCKLPMQCWQFNDLKTPPCVLWKHARSSQFIHENTFSKVIHIKMRIMEKMDPDIQTHLGKHPNKNGIILKTITFFMTYHTYTGHFIFFNHVGTPSPLRWDFSLNIASFKCCVCENNWESLDMA